MKPITMQDVRLCAGEGKLSAATVLQACNAVIRQRLGAEAASPAIGQSDRLDDLRSRLQSSEAAHAQALALVGRYREALEEGAKYLDALGDNLLRNDADMLLDDCEDPKEIAARLRLAALSEKPDLEVSQSQPGADVGPIAHARVEAEPSAASLPMLRHKLHMGDLGSGPVFDALAALETLVKYGRWQVGPESMSHHPTLPSAVAAASAALDTALLALGAEAASPADAELGPGKPYQPVSTPLPEAPK